MIAKCCQKKLLLALLLVVLAGGPWLGCSTPPVEPEPGQPVTGPPPAGQAPGAEVGRVYLEDIRVPSELEYDADASILYETTKFKAGVLRFSKWRLDVQSVIDFFLVNMPKEKWTFVNAFRGKEAYLSFSKPEKTCLIRITETWMGTVKVVIAVGPLEEKK